MKKLFVLKAMILTAVMAFASGSAMANMAQLKAYKEAFPGSKPKCASCHVDAAPKKEDGKHDWNEYGLKVKKLIETAKQTADAETYKAAGKNEEVPSE